MGVIYTLHTRERTYIIMCIQVFHSFSQYYCDFLPYRTRSLRFFLLNLQFVIYVEELIMPIKNDLQIHVNLLHLNIPLLCFPHTVCTVHARYKFGVF